MWIKVKNGKIVERVRNTPKTIYDATLDDHVRINNVAKRNQLGWYRLIMPEMKPSETIDTLTLVEEVDRSYYTYTTKARVFEDAEDMDGNKIEDAIEVVRKEKLRELRELVKKVQDAARPYTQMKKDLDETLPASFNGQKQALFDKFKKVKKDIEDETDVAILADYELPYEMANNAVASMQELI